MPTSRLVLKLIRFIYEVSVFFFAIVAPVVNDNLGNPIRMLRCSNLDLNILIVMLETKLKSITITDIIPSKDWFMYSSYLAFF